MKRKWNHVSYSHCSLHGVKLPEDGSWSVWKDKFGRIEIARFKFDGEDHFFPRSKIHEKDVVAWRKLREK